MMTQYEKIVLVTGGAGFIGSTYLNAMVLQYPSYFFVNVDALTSVSDLHNIEVSKKENYVFVQENICNKDGLEKIFIEHKPTHVVHFAAESHVDVSITNPSIFIETNLVGTGNLLSLSLAHSIQRFLQISTDEVYGSLGLDDAPFTEETPLAPNSPYSASKAGSDLLVRSYNKTYGLDTVTTRCSNNYGPRQDRTKFIPCAITALQNDEKIPVYGKGENIRDWLHVDDHVTALDIAFHKGTSGEIYNIGGGTEMTNVEIARLLSVFARKKDWFTFVEDRKGHDFRYAIDSSKIQALGWNPKKTFTDGLRDTFDWYNK